MSSRAIRTSQAQESCDVCGRTLLRGERAEIYVGGGGRRAVCQLCTSRALHEGWVREGEVPSYDERGARPERRRSLLDRLFGGRRAGGGRRDEPGDWRDDDPRAREELDGVLLDGDADGDDAGWEGRARRPSRRGAGSGRRWLPGADSEHDAPEAGRAGRARAAQGRAQRAPGLSVGREPRHVHAVPTSIEHRISSAVELFNDSEHTRTIAGVARSLGLPEVSVHPSGIGGSVVLLVVSWELCWYRYETDLSEEVPAVRLAGQGYELSDLTDTERQVNAVADERGRLHLA